MTEIYDPMIQFRRGREKELQARGELCLLRLSAIMCLFPERQQIRTIENGWTLTVCEEDWPKVEKAFRCAHPEMGIKAI